MKLSERVLLAVYDAALQIYPAEFRAKYREPMLDAARRSLAESTHDLRLLAGLVWDTGWSALREHWQAASPAKAGYVVLFAVMVSGMLLFTSVVYQTALRRGANREPARLVAEMAQSGGRVAEQRSDGRELSTHYQKIIPLQHLKSVPGEDTVQIHSLSDLLLDAPDISSKEWLQSSSTFTAAYMPDGRVMGATATLHGRLPQPPPGVFNYMRAHGEDWVSWQPEVGVRVALVGQQLGNKGFASEWFVIAGQSIVRGEALEDHFNRVLWWIWTVAMLGMVGVFLVAQRRAAA